MSLERARVDIVLAVGDDRVASAAARALSVETDGAPPRTTVRVEARGPELVLALEAEDARALRAGVNSYLRWADAAVGVARAALRPKQPLKPPG